MLAKLLNNTDTFQDMPLSKDIKFKLHTASSNYHVIQCTQ